MGAIYSANIRDLAPYAPGLMEKVSRAFPDRARKIRAYVRADDRLRSLAAGLLLERALGNREILYGEYGKPYVDGGPYFSVSHSGDYAILAVDDEPVGVDIEQWSDVDYVALSRVSFHKDECERVECEPSARTFFDIWTLKESYIKLLGTGFSEDMTGFCVNVEGCDARVDADKNVSLRLYDDLKGYSVALCLTHPRWPGMIRKLRLPACCNGNEIVWREVF
jgi:4'-phosphopantetheinyl transferase